MKMNSAQIEHTLHQFAAQPIPPGHPLMPQLQRLFGDHTYFLDRNGLNIVEPVAAEQANGQRCVVVNLASWADEKHQDLQAHQPEATNMVVNLAIDGQ